jgi:nitrate reductase NapD
MNISSIVVQVNPKHTDEVIKKLQEADFCEYHQHDEKGRIIITIEGKGVEEEMLKLKQVQAIPKVVSAEMVYSYAEDELEQERNKIEMERKIPEWLNDENVKAEDIKYQGSLKGKF